MLNPDVAVVCFTELATFDAVSITALAILFTALVAVFTVWLAVETTLFATCETALATAPLTVVAVFDTVLKIELEKLLR